MESEIYEEAAMGTREAWSRFRKEVTVQIHSKLYFYLQSDSGPLCVDLSVLADASCLSNSVALSRIQLHCYMVIGRIPSLVYFQPMGFKFSWPIESPVWH